MTTLTLTLSLHVLLCSALFHSCFCRLVGTDESTHVLIHVAFWRLSVVSLVCGLAPYTGWMRPSWPTLALLAATVSTQIVTAFYWHPGVPSPFVRRHVIPRNDRSKRDGIPSRNAKRSHDLTRIVFIDA